MTAVAAYYQLSLDVDVDGGMARITITVFDASSTLIAEHSDRWVTFCWTWQDLAVLIERIWTANGGQVNNILSRPSPYVDLT